MQLPAELRILMQIAGKRLDCAVRFAGRPPHALGSEYRVGIVFSCPELAREAISRTREFELWERRVVARGEVLSGAGGEAQ